jgi:hypothetical protein
VIKLWSCAVNFTPEGPGPDRYPNLTLIAQQLAPRASPPLASDQRPNANKQQPQHTHNELIRPPENKNTTGWPPLKEFILLTIESKFEPRTLMVLSVLILT